MLRLEPGSAAYKARDLPAVLSLQPGLNKCCFITAFNLVLTFKNDEVDGA